MKKVLFACCATLIIMTSCNQQTDHKSNTSDKAEKNLAAARSIANTFKTGETSVLDSVVADDFLDHTDRGDKIGRDSLKAMVSMIHRNFKDMKMDVISEVADDEYVFQWMRYSGTSDGNMGMPAGPYDMKSIEVSKFKDGKVVEHWAYMDVNEMSKMMEAAKASANKAGTDTTKK